MRVLLIIFCLMRWIVFAKGPEGISGIQTQESPWFTGPLLSPSGKTFPAGQINYEPYFYATVSNARYDGNWHTFKTDTVWTVKMQQYLQYGIMS